MEIIALMIGKTNLTNINLTLPLPFMLSCLFAFFTAKACNRAGINNKTIDKANTPLFREIPCNKDMYYANCLVSLNDKLYKEYQETNIFGAIILKWVKENKVTFKVDPKGIFNKNNEKRLQETI